VSTFEEAPESNGSLLKKPRLIVVAHRVGNGGGMEYVHAQFIRALADKWDISVVAAELDVDLQTYVTWYRVRVPKRPVPIRISLFCIIAGVRLCSISPKNAVVHSCGAIVPNRVDVASVHFCHTGWVAAAGRLAPEGGGVLRRANTGLKRLIAVSMEKWCYRPQRVLLLHAVSEGVKDELSEQYPGVPIRVLSNGVDIEDFYPDAVARHQIREKCRIAESTTIALFVGGDWDRKGLEIALRSVAAARGMGSDLRLWVVGGGNYVRFQKIAEDLEIGPQVHFFGPQDRLNNIYNGADVMVLPSDYEASPLVVREAAACRLPIVVTPVHGVREVLGDNEGGFVEEADSENWARILTELAGNPDLRRTLGKVAHERVAKLDWGIVSKTMDQMLHEICEEHHGKTHAMRANY